MKWSKMRLGDVITFRGGGTPRKDVAQFWGKEIPWATVKDFKSLSLSKTQDFITKEGLKASSANLIPAGHVIIPTRMALGKAAINTIDLAINQDLRALIPNIDIDSTYLLHAMLGLAEEIERHGSGATVKGITQRKLSELGIIVPPLSEQKRIAGILDAADALRAKRRESLAQLDALLQSTFLEMFGDPLRNSMGWYMGVVGDFLESANYGTSRKADPKQGNYPVLRMNNITYKGSWDFSQLKYVDLTEKEAAKHLVHKGQVLFNRTNSKELVGKTAVYREDTPMAFAGYLVRGVVNEKAHPEYIGAFMNTPHIKLFLRNKCKSIVGMANINAKEFQAIPMPKPPLDLQVRFATIVDSIEQQKSRLRAHLAELDALFASLQARAFAGEL